MILTEAQINRMVLAYLADLLTVPQTETEIADYLHLRTGRVLADEAARSCQRLQLAGYVADARPTAADAPMWRITDAGARQQARRVRTQDLDPIIWG